MAKILVLPTKPSLLQAPTGEVINAFRPTVITRTGFSSMMIGQGKIEICSDSPLMDDVTDEDFAEIFNSKTIKSESDGSLLLQTKLAVEHFVTKFAATDSNLEERLARAERLEQEAIERAEAEEEAKAAKEEKVALERAAKAKAEAAAEEEKTKKAAAKKAADKKAGA